MDQHVLKNCIGFLIANFKRKYPGTPMDECRTVPYRTLKAESNNIWTICNRTKEKQFQLANGAPLKGFFGLSDLIWIDG